MSLCFQNGLPALTLRTHLLRHDLLDFRRRLNVLDLNTGYFDSPGICRFIQDRLHPAVDGIPAGQGLVQLHLTDDITKSRGRQILKTGNRALNAVGVQLRIKNLTEYDRVDLHGDVIFGNNGLRREVKHLLLEADPAGNPLDKRGLQMQSRAPGHFIASQAFNDIGLCLRNDPHVCDDNRQYHNQKHNNSNHTFYLLQILHKSHFLPAALQSFRDCNQYNIFY